VPTIKIAAKRDSNPQWEMDIEPSFVGKIDPGTVCRFYDSPMIPGEMECGR